MSKHRVCPDCGYIDPSPKEDYEARIAELKAENQRLQEMNQLWEKVNARLGKENQQLRGELELGCGLIEGYHPADCPTGLKIWAERGRALLGGGE